MDYEITEKGHLRFTLDTDERTYWAEERAEKDYIDMDEVFYESGLAGNCDLDTLRPEQIGALTSAPIFGEGIEYDPGGVVGCVARVWWFPDYMIRDPLEVMLEKGEVIFTAAPENAEKGGEA